MDDDGPTRLTAKEKALSTNTLVCLVQALRGHRTTVELRNEAEVYGTIEDVDGYMNVTLSGATFTDPVGNRARFDRFFVHGRQIRYVQIPDQVSPLSAIEQQLQRYHGGGRGGRGGRQDETDQMKRSRRTKKAEAYTRETVRAMNRGGPASRGRGRSCAAPAPAISTATAISTAISTATGTSAPPTSVASDSAVGRPGPAHGRSATAAAGSSRGQRMWPGSRAACRQQQPGAGPPPSSADDADFV